jgi:hypothetical protein
MRSGHGRRERHRRPAESACARSPVSAVDKASDPAPISDDECGTAGSLKVAVHLHPCIHINEVGLADHRMSGGVVAFDPGSVGMLLVRGANTETLVCRGLKGDVTPPHGTMR